MEPRHERIARIALTSRGSRQNPGRKSEATPGSCWWLIAGFFLPCLVGRDDPSVAGVGAAHFLGESVPVADGEAAVIVFVHDGVYPRVARRDARAYVGHHCRHEDVAGAFTSGEGMSLPLQRYSHDLQLRCGEAGAVACLKDDPLVRGNPEEVPCHGEGEQEAWISIVGMRVKRPVG
jgi:hypothetical protein